MQKSNQNSNDFFPGRFSLDRMTNTGGSQKKSQTPSLFSQSSQQTFGHSSYESTGTPSSKSNYRYDEVVSINRHKEILEALGNVNNSILKLGETISRQVGTIKLDLEGSLATMVEEIQANSIHCETNNALSKELTVDLVNVIASVKKISEIVPPLATIAHPASSPFLLTDDGSDSDDGVSLSQYMSVKTKTSIKIAEEEETQREIKQSNYVKPTVTSSVVSMPNRNCGKPAQNMSSQAKRLRENVIEAVPGDILSKKRLRTPSSRLAESREESMGMSFLFDSFSLEKSSKPAVPKQTAQMVQVGASKPLKHVVAAVTPRSVPRKVSAPVAKLVEDSQLTQLSAESYSYHSEDDEGSTTSCFTFDDDSYLTEPLFYK